MTNSSKHAPDPAPRPAFTWDLVVATWFGSGLLPKAPGTWGSLAALICGFAIVELGGVLALALAAVALFPLGVLASERYAARIGKHDPGSVVVDEVVGQWIAILPAASLGFAGYGVAFLAFRLFDILKPWPINVLDRRLPGGFGIMADDVMAGIYAALVMAGAVWAIA